ncbi:response regulator [Lysobacter korlensis]|uniref:Response regulator n=1 Tax=Lysobacter korlensis TaxID=553636 RepID=A0ABV6RRK3_9GAMM
MTAQVLVIEDNADLLLTLALVLEAEGCKVQQALNGHQACELLVERGTAPDLIVLDLQMPVMDGWQFVKTLAQLDLAGADTVPLMVITASGHAPAWAAAVVRKPFEIEQLLDTVRALLGEAPANR